MYPIYVQAQWPRPQIQIDWIDQEITVAAWLDLTIGVTAWEWADGPKEYICVNVQKPEQATLIKLHFG